MVEEREGEARDMVRKDLEEILERRENRAREMEREGVKKMLRSGVGTWKERGRR